MKHENIERCLRCDEKLKQAHPALVSWFWWLKDIFPQVHIAWSFRGKEDQEREFQEGRSRLNWPESKHNWTENGQPCSKALDLFELENNGDARFDEHFYEKINEENIKEDAPIRWGGTFKHFKDLDHFELVEGH